MQRGQEVGHGLSRYCRGVVPGWDELRSGNDLVEGPFVDQVLGPGALRRQPPLPYPSPDRLRVATHSLRRLGNR